MSDGEEDAFQGYFLALEEHFGRLRGSPLLLSPRDVALAREWHEAGLPLEAVLRGIDRFFVREAKRRVPRRGAVSLAYVETDVVLAYEDRKASWMGAHQPGEGDPEPLLRLRALLAHAVERLRAVAGRADEAGQPGLERALSEAAERVFALLSALERDEQPETLQQELAAVEAVIERALRKPLDAAEVEALREAAAAELRPYAQRLGKKARRDLERRVERRQLFARHEIPCLSRLLE